MHIFSVLLLPSIGVLIAHVISSAANAAPTPEPFSSPTYRTMVVTGEFPHEEDDNSREHTPMEEDDSPEVMPEEDQSAQAKNQPKSIDFLLQRKYVLDRWIRSSRVSLRFGGNRIGGSSGSRNSVSGGSSGVNSRVAKPGGGGFKGSRGRR